MRGPCVTLMISVALISQDDPTTPPLTYNAQNCPPKMAPSLDERSDSDADQASHQDDDDLGDSTDEPSSNHRVYSQRTLRWMRLGCILLNFMVEMFDQIIIVPQLALMEKSVCNSYYSAKLSTAALDCKAEPVQHKLATLRSWKALFECIAVLLVSIPLGAMSDRFGRKGVLLASLVASSLAVLWTIFICLNDFPTNLVWLSAVFFLFGNLSIANTTIYTMAADTSDPSNRSQYFYYLYSTFLVTELLAPAITSATMDQHILIPFIVGFAFLLFILPVLIIMPETLMVKEIYNRESRKDTRPLLATETIDARKASDETVESFKVMLGQRRIIMAMGILFIGALRPAMVSVLFQYAMTRFDWPLSQTAMMVSEIAIVNIVIFLVVLPQLVSWLSTRYSVGGQSINYTIVLGSLVILAVGALVIGSATSTAILHLGLLVFAAGYGTRVAVFSLLADWIHDKIRARTLATTQVVENLGKLCAEPLLLKAYAASLPLTGFWRGLPFFLGAGVFTVSAIGWLLQ
ncbi:major facilitator superfamily domain-containing protein [Hypoxylon sp. FL1150]|nr:major facilitator superfamily domain-containing protein [Hypoxylon sp. FL1150]